MIDRRPAQLANSYRSGLALLLGFLLITAAMTYDRSTRKIHSALIDRYSKHLRAICANNIKFTIGTFTNESFAGWLNLSKMGIHLTQVTTTCSVLANGRDIGGGLSADLGGVGGPVQQ
jgi:hypothetical protein